MLDDSYSDKPFEDFICELEIHDLSITIEELVYSFAFKNLKNYFGVDPKTGLSINEKATQGYFNLGNIAINKLLPHLNFETEDDNRIVFLFFYEKYNRLRKLYQQCFDEKINPTWANVVKNGSCCRRDFDIFDELWDIKYRQMDIELYGELSEINK